MAGILYRTGMMLVLILCIVMDGVIGQIDSQANLDKMAEGLQVTWDVTTNTKEELSFQVEITLENRAHGVSLNSGDWELRLGCIYMIEPDLLGLTTNSEADLVGQGLRITHLQGSMFYFEPTQDFITLPPGGTRKIKLKVLYWSVAKSDTMPNWYLAVKGNRFQPKVIKSTEGESLSFVGDRTTPPLWKRYNYDYYNPYSTQDRYDRNYIPHPNDHHGHRLIPRPLNMTLTSQDQYVTFDPTTWSYSYTDNALGETARYLASNLNMTESQIGQNNPATERVISLSLGDVTVVSSDSRTANSDEAYSVKVMDNRVDIVGRQPSGVFYGVISLLGLLTPESTLPECSIVDSPRFPYRGVMLDIARNFHDKDEIIQIIQVMSQYKLNYLHLHLTDDEGWRIQIPALPELTELGSQRCHDDLETGCLMPQIGSGPDNSTQFGSGYLTADDYLAILAVASSHHIIVIPEVDMPGHARAAIKAMELRHANFEAQGQGVEGERTLLSEPGDKSEYFSVQMFSDNAINPCLESTYHFVDVVLTELISLHQQGGQPLISFHMGGDEVGRGAWVNSTACQSLKNQSVLPDDSPKKYFFQRVSQLVKNHSLSMGVWEDGAMDSGNIPFQLASDSPDVLAYAWDNIWEFGTLPRTYRLANQGYKVVMAHATHLYFDHPYEPDPEERGYYWAPRFLDTKKAFSYTAERFYDNVNTKRSGETISPEELCGELGQDCPPLTVPNNIIGLEAPIFGDITRTQEHVHSGLFPRLLAMAERAWHQADWESLPPGSERDSLLQQDWASFVRAVGQRELPNLESSNVLYRLPPPGAKLQNHHLVATPLYPGLTVQYSLDGGHEWIDLSTPLPLKEYVYRVWLRSRSVDGTRFSRTVIFHPEPQLPVSNQPVIDYIASNLKIGYTVVDNYIKYGDSAFEAKITISNEGNHTIGAGDWSIYFNSVLRVEKEAMSNGKPYVDHVTKMAFSHVNGYLFKFGPTAEFSGLHSGEQIDIIFKVEYWSVSRTDQCPNWYVNSPACQGRIIENTADEDLSFVSPFLEENQYKRMEYDQYDPWTPATRFDRNDHLDVTPVDKSPVIPSLKQYSRKSQNTLNIQTFTAIYTSGSLKSTVERFTEMASTFLNISISSTSEDQNQNYIRFHVGAVTADTDSREAYLISLDVTNRSVDVIGRSEAGVSYGAMTLLQLAFKSSNKATLPDCDIVDWPRYTYRGMHLDVARNFQPKSSVLKLLNVMALYKMNVLHFHLTDDEGWRLEIPGMEELTQIGGQRCHDLQEKECIMTTLGSGPELPNTGSGFYTVQDYQEILRAAAEHHIEVIPEIETPGHAHAVIKSMQARRDRLQDIGDEDDAGMYLLSEDHDLSQYLSVQFYTDNAINPCIESTYRFIAEVLHQIEELHKDIQPLRVFHFGGDEVAHGAWQKSNACRSLLEEGANLKREFTRRVSLLTQNLTLAGWEDGLTDTANMPWNRSWLANEEILVHAWQNVWEWGTGARAYNLANNGYKVVLTPVTHLYLDHPQEPDPEERGFYWGTRYTDVYKTFSFMPDHWYLNADVRRSGEPITIEEICREDMSGCPPLKHPENIIGIQGALWSEVVRQSDHLDFMVFPRLLAIAERAWHRGAWEGQPSDLRDPDLRADWAHFAGSLGRWDLEMLDHLGVAYRVPPPGARQNKATISTNVEFHDLPIQYRVKDSDQEWQPVDPKRTFTTGQGVQFRSTTPDGRRFSREISIKMAAFASTTSPGAGTAVSVSSTIIALCLTTCLVYIRNVHFL